MRKNKNMSKIILAVIVAVMAMAGSYSGFKNMNAELEEKNRMIQAIQTNKQTNLGDYVYAVAKADLKAGEIISDEDVDFKGFETINSDAFDNRTEVINKVLLKDIKSGDVFTTAHIAQISGDDLLLKEGYRALTLPMGKFEGQSANMTLGTYVDIYGAGADNDWTLQKVKIIGIDGGTAADGEKPTVSGLSSASSVTFEVPTGDISDFISNIAKGSLMLVARSQNDNKIVRRKPKIPNIGNIGSIGNYSSSSIPNLPNLPVSPAPESISNLSGLPQPVSPVSHSSSVEVIEANVKSQVTFD